jgi:hypothetical protein
MATGRISIYDRVAQCSTPLIVSAEPQLDSTNSPWIGIKLEHYRIGASDRPDATISGYLAAVCLSGSYETEYAPGFGQRGFSTVYQPETLFLTGPGDMPARHSTGEIEFLALENSAEIRLMGCRRTGYQRTFRNPATMGSRRRSASLHLADLVQRTPRQLSFRQVVR